MEITALINMLQITYVTVVTIITIITSGALTVTIKVTFVHEMFQYWIIFKKINKVIDFIQKVKNGQAHRKCASCTFVIC